MKSKPSRPTSILILLALFMLRAVAAAAEPTEPASPDGDFSPAGAFAFVLVLAVLFVLIGIGIVIGLLGIAFAALFVALGLVSSSALIAMVSRRFSAGFRALHYQLLALACLPGGIGVLWLMHHLLHFQLRAREILIFGAFLGAAAGLCIAFIFDWCARWLYRRYVPAPVFPLPASPPRLTTPCRE